MERGRQPGQDLEERHTLPREEQVQRPWGGNEPGTDVGEKGGTEAEAQCVVKQAGAWCGMNSLMRSAEHFRE